MHDQNKYCQRWKRRLEEVPPGNGGTWTAEDSQAVHRQWKIDDLADHPSAELFGHTRLELELIHPLEGVVSAKELWNCVSSAPQVQQNCET